MAHETILELGSNLCTSHRLISIFDHPTLSLYEVWTLIRTTAQSLSFVPLPKGSLLYVSSDFVSAFLLGWFVKSLMLLFDVKNQAGLPIMKMSNIFKCFKWKPHQIKKLARRSGKSFHGWLIGFWLRNRR